MKVIYFVLLLLFGTIEGSSRLLQSRKGSKGSQGSQTGTASGSQTGTSKSSRSSSSSEDCDTTEPPTCQDGSVLEINNNCEFPACPEQCTAWCIRLVPSSSSSSSSTSKSSSSSSSDGGRRRLRNKNKNSKKGRNRRKNKNKKYSMYVSYNELRASYADESTFVAHSITSVGFERDGDLYTATQGRCSEAGNGGGRPSKKNKKNHDPIRCDAALSCVCGDGYECQPDPRCVAHNHRHQGRGTTQCENVCFKRDLECEGSGRHRRGSEAKCAIYQE